MTVDYSFVDDDKLEVGGTGAGFSSDVS